MELAAPVLVLPWVEAGPLIPSSHSPEGQSQNGDQIGNSKVSWETLGVGEIGVFFYDGMEFYQRQTSPAHRKFINRFVTLTLWKTVKGMTAAKTLLSQLPRLSGPDQLGKSRVGDSSRRCWCVSSCHPQPYTPEGEAVNERCQSQGTWQPFYKPNGCFYP